MVSGGFLYWQTGLKALHTAQKEISRASHDVTVASTEGSKMKAGAFARPVAMLRRLRYCQDVGAAMLQNLEGIPLTCPAGTQQQAQRFWLSRVVQGTMCCVSADLAAAHWQVKQYVDNISNKARPFTAAEPCLWLQ